MKNTYNKNRDILVLIISKPKPDFAERDDAKTARWFFKNSKKFAEISNIDRESIKTMHIILIAVDPGHNIILINSENYLIYWSTL